MDQATIAGIIFGGAAVALSYRSIRYAVRGDRPAFGWWRW